MRFAFALLAVTLVGGTACRDTQGGVMPNNNNNTNDAGNTTMTCTRTVDCGGVGVCVAGICEAVSACTVNADCADEGGVCHSQRFFCVECDGMPGQCPPGETCQSDFSCASVQTSPMTECMGSCPDRNQCGMDEVCKDGGCCPPPSRCRGPEDCPTSAPDCNGATGQCFGGTGCFNDRECETEPGCAAGACFCDIQGTPPGRCTVRPDECQTDPDCFENGVFAQKFCTIANPPKRCAAAPACTSDAECAASGLVCDMTAGSPSMGYCQNGTPCTPNGNECSNGAVCDQGICRPPNCGNTPSLCQADEVCDPVTLMCVPMQGGTCTTNSECNAGYFCNTSTSMCEVGCRDNTECMGGICNAQNMCEFPMGQFCGPCMVDTDCPANGRCVDNPFTGKTCYESCSTVLMQPCSDPADSCIFGNCSCL